VKGVLNEVPEVLRHRTTSRATDGGQPQGSAEYMVQASKELEMMPTTEGALDLKLNLTHVIDGFHGNEHTLPITPLYIRRAADVRQVRYRGNHQRSSWNYGGPFARTTGLRTARSTTTPSSIISCRTGYDPTREPSGGRAAFRKDEYEFPKLAAQMTKLVRAGGLVGVGSHGQMQASVPLGVMDVRERRDDATRSSAMRDGERGENHRQPEGSGFHRARETCGPRHFRQSRWTTSTIRIPFHWVMKNGELFEGDTLNQVWPEQKKLEPLWFWNNYDVPKAGEPLNYGKTVQP